MLLTTPSPVQLSSLVLSSVFSLMSSRHSVRNNMGPKYRGSQATCCRHFQHGLILLVLRPLELLSVAFECSSPQNQMDLAVAICPSPNAISTRTLTSRPPLPTRSRFAAACPALPKSCRSRWPWSSTCSLRLLSLVALCTASICCPHSRVRQPSSCRITAAIVCPTRQLPLPDSPSRPHTRHAQHFQQPRQSTTSKSDGFLESPSRWLPSTATIVAPERLPRLLVPFSLVSRAEPIFLHFPMGSSWT